MSKKELIELCKDGDEQALSLLYKTYADKMMKICSYYVTDKHIAQDLLHDGFIIIFTSIHALQSPDKLESWMRTIMKNLSLRYLKQCNRTNCIASEEMDEDEEPADVACTEDFPSYAMMLRLIDTLPEGYGKIFKLAVLEGLSHKEIGMLLNIAPHSSSSQLARAKERLRKLFSQYRIIVGLFALLSVVSLRIFHRHAEKKTVVAEQKNGNERSEKAPDPGPVLPEKAPEDHRIRATVSRQRYAASVEPPNANKRHPIRPDSLMEGTDSLPVRKRLDVNPVIADDKPHGKTVPQRSADKRNGWTLSFSYAAGGNLTSSQRYSLSDKNEVISGQPKEGTERSRHRIPVTFSLSVQKRINERWGIETGVQYTYLRSDFVTLYDTHSERTQQLHYIGIPLKGTFNFWSKKNLSLYVSAGATLDIPVKATSEESVRRNGQTVLHDKRDLNPSLQGSTTFGIGVQYQLTPSIGIYAEPSLHYYFNNGNHIKTLRTEKPFNATLPVGLRLSW